MTLKEEKVVKNYIKKLVRESFYSNMGMYEADGEKSNKENDSNSDVNNKRKRVIAALKKDGVDVAQYAYRLWPDKDEDSARSYFYKCLDGEKNDNGVPYEFDDDEIVTLYSMLSNDSI